MADIDHITDQSGGVITRAQLEAFTFHGHAIKLHDPSRGIRNPATLPATLSIPTNPRSGYPDQAGPDGFPRYSIRTGDWAHGENRKLHAAFELEVPIIWLQTISPDMRPEGGTGSRRTDRSSIRKPWASPLTSRTRPPTASNTGARHVTVLGGRASTR